jgi:FlaA1/EpsC-like NDP-sugar epimerase
VCGFLDDDARLHGHHLDGLKVYAPADLSRYVRKLAIKEVLLAIPSSPQRRRLEIIEALRPHPVHVRTLPGLSALASGKVEVADLRELDIEDLLGRDPVPPNGLLMNRHIHDKVVLVTGAGGSIGSELCRQIAGCRPARLLLVEHSEFALYSVHRELSAAGVAVIPLLGSVCDEPRMVQILSTWRPHTVYHAAAYKHVPLVEHNPAQGVFNNVWGTLVCARAAQAAGVQQFVLISTDKAVRPTNIMGASKRLAEMVLQALAVPSREAAVGAKGTCFAMVRFGNVLGSSGSVVPLFREQIARGGPVTLTHADITRYFMTIPEAAQLVIQAGAMASGGEVYVLDMGQPVRIMDLARRLIDLSGLQVRDADNPDGDIEIHVTGLRPGEKLYEELLIGDNPEPTAHARIMKAREAYLPWVALEAGLRELHRRLDANDVPGLKEMLASLVSGYQPEREVVDWVWQESELMSQEAAQLG